MQWRIFGVGVALTGLAASGLTWDHLQASAVEQHSIASDHVTTKAALYPRSPSEVLRVAADMTSRDDPQACELFEDAAALEFAAALRAPSCPVAVRKLAGQITDFTTYASYAPHSVVVLDRGPDAVVDGCSLRWGNAIAPQPDAGPGFGRLTVSRITPSGGGGWIIDHYQPCPPPPSTTAATAPPVTRTPSTTGLRRQPPMYAPAYGQLLGRAIANGDGGVCELFVADAARQFAVAHATPSCEEAILALSQQVSHPAWYSTQPGGITTTTDSAGHIVVHACTLNWNSLGPDNVPAGPPMGHLTTAAEGGGFVIVGYQPCP
ncbi:hypothetical protein MOQ72_37205 [Saccharopolyspora sp. K220]|uniref:hypothetical protein n=1 Tax=Saccharopolyspora soli TaxID=2926618 RepID=UPI001F59078E|nr:hypothetical protein [Saccharopolyspora soli]MCI2423071.1 hypothetical protein [Saccharopolyspora soli]